MWQLNEYYVDSDCSDQLHLCSPKRVSPFGWQKYVSLHNLLINSAQCCKTTEIHWLILVFAVHIQANPFNLSTKKNVCKQTFVDSDEMSSYEIFIRIYIVCHSVFNFWMTLFAIIDMTLNIFANNVDPDGTAHNESSHQDPFCFWFLADILISNY